MNDIRGFDRALDECLDRIAAGEDIDSCLSRHPQYATGLRPLLATYSTSRLAADNFPTRTAVEKARERMLAARRARDRLTNERPGILGRLFSRPLVFAGVASIAVIALSAVLLSNLTDTGAPVPSTSNPESAVVDGSAGAPSEAGIATAVVVSQGTGEANFRLLISDEPNDIGDFQELWVMVSGVGLVQGDDEGLFEYHFDEPVYLNLAPLTGENAVALWQGNVPEGTYTKVFIYVDEVHGLLDEGGAIEIKLPSSKLQIGSPVTIGDEDEGTLSEFVFDVTVHRAGNSGTYILNTQVTESGEGRNYQILEQNEERVRNNRPEWAGRPESPGKSESRGNVGNNRPENANGIGDDDDDALPGIEVKKTAEAVEGAVRSTIAITNDCDLEVTVVTVTDTVYWHERGPDWEYLAEFADEQGYTIAVGDVLTLNYEIEVEVPSQARELRNEVEVVIEGRDKVFRDRISLPLFGHVEEIEFEGIVDSLEPLVVTTDSDDTYTILTDADTEVEGSLEVGGTVEIEGWLQPDGTVLAREIEASEQGEGDNGKAKGRGGEDD